MNKGKCKYCENDKRYGRLELSERNESQPILIQEDKEIIVPYINEYSVENECKISIVYCPMCGRKL